jgi:hypothetical protein
MAMTPQELERMTKLEQLVQSLVKAENVPFIESITRRLVDSFNIPVNLNDLADVNAPSPSSGQVLEWNGSAWVNATDNV